MQFVRLLTPWLVCLMMCGLAAASDVERDHKIVPEDYFDLAFLNACVLSPDGQAVAWVESRWSPRPDEGRLNDLWVMDLDQRTARRLSFDGVSPSGVVWSSDNRDLYFSGRWKGPSEDEVPWDGSRQVWRVSSTGGEIFPLTRCDDGMGSFVLAPDDARLYYTVSDEVHYDEWQDLKKEYGDLEYGHGVSDLDAIRRLDLTTWRDTEILPAERVIHEMSLSPDGRQLAMIATDDEEIIFKEGWSRVEILALDTGRITSVTDQAWRADHPSAFGWLEELAWSGDSRALAFSISYDGHPTRIHVAEADTWRPREVVRPDSVDFNGGLGWRGDDRTLCWRGESKACVRLYATEKIKDGGQGGSRLLTPGSIVAGPWSFDRRGKRLVCGFETTTDGIDLYLVDKKGRYDRLTRLNPQIDTWELPSIEVFSWTGADGDPVEGILELPPGYERGDGPLPLVVELHGGPTSSTKLRLRLWMYGRAVMASEGYALLSPNYHGSTGYGDEFMEKLIGRENEIEVKDISTGIDALVAAGFADPDRIGVMGWSNGGYLTNCMIVAEPERFKAASTGAGVLDQVIQWGIEDTPGHVVNFMEGLPWEKADHYRAGSPIYGLDRVRTPTLIHVGSEDARVPIAHSRALYRALHHYLDVPVELVVYPGSGHGLRTQAQRLAKIKWDLAWFEKYLRGGEDD